MQEWGSNESLMNCEAALGSRTPFASPYGEQRGWDNLGLDPLARRNTSRSLLEVLASRIWVEALDWGARPVKLLLLCHQEHENTRLESAAPPFSLPSTLSFSMSVYHTPNQNPAQSNGLKDPVYQWTNYTGFQYLLELQSTGTGP